MYLLSYLFCLLLMLIKLHCLLLKWISNVLASFGYLGPKRAVTYLEESESYCLRTSFTTSTAASRPFRILKLTSLKGTMS